MAVTATFKQGTKIAVQVDRNTAPSGWPSGSAWWQGGRWHDIITDGLPSIQDAQETIFPTGHAGKRAINQQVPIKGRVWGEGDLSAPVAADFLGVILYGGLGSGSTQEYEGTTASLLADEPIQTDPKSFVLSGQPSDSGAILGFEIKGTKDAGTISVCGIDSYGNGASEQISFASGGMFYTRTSFSSIAASGIAISGVSAASVTIIGHKYFEHTFTANSDVPNIAIERIGVPTAGCAASKSHMHLGMTVTEFTLNTPAADRDGLFTVDVSFEGDPAATCNAASHNHASPLKIWPAWSLEVTKDGNTWQKVTDFSLTMATGNRNYRAAAGTQRPQGTFYGPQELTGNFSILLDDEDEYNRWLGASSMAMYARWNTAWKLTGTQNQELGASMIVYLENVTVDDDDDAFSLSADFRTIEDANWGIGQFKLINGVPAGAYGL